MNSSINIIACRLAKSIPDTTERKVVARTLYLACEHGAGNAAASLALSKLPKEAIRNVGRLLGLSYAPKCGGEMAALLLLEQESSRPEVAALLKELDEGATSGDGCPF